MTSTSEPSHAQPGLYALQMIVGAVKQEPVAPHALVSRNPYTSPPGQSASLWHPVSPSVGFGHEPTTQEHAPVETGSHVMLRDPLPGQGGTGGSGPHQQGPACGGGAHTGQTSPPLASFCAITPYLQSGRLQTGAGGHEPPSGGGAQIGHVGHPFTSVPVPTDPKAQGTQGSATHASVGQSGKPQSHFPFGCSSQTLSVRVVPSGHTFARAGTARPTHDAGVHAEPASTPMTPPSVRGPASSPDPTKMGPPGAQPPPSAPIRSGKTTSTGAAHARRERS